jgi:hypothetical protein
MVGLKSKDFQYPMKAYVKSPEGGKMNYNNWHKFVIRKIGGHLGPPENAAFSGMS